MRIISRHALAFCTLWGVLALVGTVLPASGSTRTANIDQYTRTQVQWGATSIPVVAQLEYRTALLYARQGDRGQAESHLNAAIKLAPAYPDAYFTLARIKFRQFDPNALYFFVRGVKAMWHNFSAHSLLAVNAWLFASLALILATSIVLLALALRYLPFVAHRLSETLAGRFRAAMPRATAYLLISIPFALFPGFVSGACVLLLMTWYFMQRRERLSVIALLLPLIVMGVFSSQLERLSPLADPTSFTSLAARSNYAAGDPELITQVARHEIATLRAEKHNTLGMLYLRQEEYENAADHFLQAVALKPDHASAYVNLGNVYYQNEMWDKALEGYRKAAAVDSVDAVGQYNLAQAFIKTLLMAESSKALHNASEAGIDRVRTTFAAPALPGMEVYPKVFSPGELWRIAGIEGAAHPTGFIARAVEPALGFPLRTSAWMLLAALAMAMMLARVFKPRHLAFQCSNCGELMCEACGDSDRGTFICGKCHGVIAEVSSDKVVDALLRQRRQKVVVKRRKMVRLLTVWLPGLRDVFYGNMARGVGLTALFAGSLLGLWSRGYLWADWNSMIYPTGLWKWVVPACGIALAYFVSATSKRLMEVRNYRSPDTRSRAGDTDEHHVAQSA